MSGPQAPLLRTLALARPAAGRLVLATLLGAGAIAAAIGLIATSAWLISRSAQRPQESAVAIAIVGVQFFALARGLCRYGERLVGHDAAFRVLSRDQGRPLHAPGATGSARPAGLPQRRSARAARARRRRAAGPAAARGAALRHRPRRGRGDGRAGVGDAPGGRPDPAGGAGDRRDARAVADREARRSRRGAPGGGARGADRKRGRPDRGRAGADRQRGRSRAAAAHARRGLAPDPHRRRERPHGGHRPGPHEPVLRPGDVGRAAASAWRRSTRAG